MTTATHTTTAKFEFYPDEMYILLKAFNNCPTTGMDTDELNSYLILLEAIQEFVMINS